MSDAASLYLDLLKSALTRELFADQEYNPVVPRGWKARIITPMQRQLAKRGVELLRKSAFVDASTGPRQAGQWPRYAETMLSGPRLDNFQDCIESALRDKVAGDIIETGVWRGGACILARAILEVYDEHERTVWVADSFEGVPPPNAADYPADEGWDLSQFDALAVGVEEVKANFARYGFLDDQVKFLVGWFKDTLPSAPIKELAVARLDGDLYESTMDALSALYPKLSVGGYLIVDDYGLPPCRQAIDDYRAANGITEQIEKIDWTGVFWRRERR